VKRFGLSARYYERRGSTELAEVFTNDEDRTRWAAGGAELLRNDSLPPLLIV
jgi:hypothetical protein